MVVNRQFALDSSALRSHVDALAAVLAELLAERSDPGANLPGPSAIIPHFSLAFVSQPSDQCVSERAPETFKTDAK
jgi:hypothetical protein